MSDEGKPMVASQAAAGEEAMLAQARNLKTFNIRKRIKLMTGKR